MKIVKFKQLKEITGLSRSTLNDKIKDGSFPAPFRITGKDTGHRCWDYKDVEDWIKNLPQASGKKPKDLIDCMIEVDRKIRERENRD
jgi:predicted DNA-binding transcriptional regulator AlpA